MDPLQNIYVGLGSNQGHRFDWLQKAVDLLFEEVGRLVKISSVYQSPAIGFEGDDFYNAVVHMETQMDPQKVLAALLDIEKRLGRVRSGSRYNARCIDLDLLSYGDLELDTDTLTLPHPQIQNRRFVLEPMVEIQANWQHAALKSSAADLLKATTDNSKLIRLSKWLRNPINDLDLARLKYIAIEGNIGAGKTSLASMLARDFNGKLILERFKDNAFLPEFYKDPDRYAFPLEMSFLADRYQQLVEQATQYDLFSDLVIADYDRFKSLIFAKITLSAPEFVLYQKFFHLMHREVPRPNLYVYLGQSTDRLIENIHKRGRDYEQSIAPDYLKQIHAGYQTYLKSGEIGSPLCRIDITDMDFVKSRKDYLTIVRRLMAH
ncbi:2-amino-4-hydroxy-6-hydroxymethyldihydropteridine diphosphokinase [Flavobacteriaceae bacterium]|nr:2-amino-4-hydroxy-6-hydroxymethyldihydropteridine diphosphokinase [Flavobacteriaceae bacterium]